MNIYEKIENFVKEENERPSWVDEILYELREIKRLIKNSNEQKQKYYKFVDHLKKTFKEALQKGNSIEIEFYGGIYSINLKGYIYDVVTKKEVDAQKAFEIFHFLYYNKKNLSRYIK